MIKAIIIDDESRARSLLQKMIAEYCSDIEIVAECEDLPGGVKMIRKLKPELVFLDIEMPGHSGLELLEFFDENDVDFSIIFTTAYNDYAVQAFKLSAVDYLLKPMEPEALENAVERFKKRSQKERNNYTALRENLKQPGNMQRIAVPDANSVKFFDLDTILYFKADSSYTEIIFTDNNKLIVSRTLKNIEDALGNNTDFFRCHKSYLINMKYLTDYVKSDGGYLVLKQKHTIPISKEKIQEFLDRSTVIKR